MIERVITEKELAEYFKREPMPLHGIDPKFNAEYILDDIEKHREPEYEVGQIYISPNGNRFAFMNDGFWNEIYISGATGIVPPHTPARPLRKLVPEPEKISEEKALNIVEDWILDYTEDGVIEDRKKLLRNLGVIN